MKYLITFRTDGDKHVVHINPAHIMIIEPDPDGFRDEEGIPRNSLVTLTGGIIVKVLGNYHHMTVDLWGEEE